MRREQARDVNVPVTKTMVMHVLTQSVEMRRQLNVQGEGQVTNYLNILGVTFNNMFKSSNQNCVKVKSSDIYFKSLC